MSCLAAHYSVSDDAMLTTTEAGNLVGRTNGAVRMAIWNGSLPGQRQRDHWLVRAGDVLAWAARTQRHHWRKLPAPRTDEVVTLLQEYGTASAEEVARLLQVHVGNARKYLAILGLEGRAERRPDGQWVLREQRRDNGKGAA
jgi:hypothetical protein